MSVPYLLGFHLSQISSIAQKSLIRKGYNSAYFVKKPVRARICVKNLYSQFLLKQTLEALQPQPSKALLSALAC